MKKIKITKNELIEILKNYNNPTCASKLGLKIYQVSHLRKIHGIPSPQKAGRQFTNIEIV
jgi:hypothetical protein